MPSYPCRWPTCTLYVKHPVRFCPEHEEQGRQAQAARHKFYDQHQRDQEARAFYNSAAWKRARATKLAHDPTCAHCGHFANTVHHVIPLERCTPAQRTAQSTLLSLCSACHSSLHAAEGLDQRERIG